MLFSFILILLIIGSYFLCRSDYMIYYMEYIFPVFRNTIGRVCDLIDYSIFQWLIPILIIILIILLFKKIKYVIPYLLCITLMYQLTCGMIYQRKDIPVASRNISQDQIEALANLIQDKIDHLENKPLTLDQIIEMAPTVMENHEAGYYPHPKRIIYSIGMSKFGLTGIYSPFTLEANINIDAPLHSIAFTACHELSHLHGYMKEEQAQINAYKACVESNIPYFEYSAYQQVISQIIRYSDHQFTVPEFFLNDYHYEVEYWKSHDGKLTELENKVNDTYLNIHGDQGVISYSQMIYDLIDYYRL